ncbi:MaoC family dehydratase [Oceanobacillus sp. J11TS1]|uniref:MaoC family dehydratase n=1 Tax=Oceanobacillus sp. J11TS1 TaxID=2807191 RepID=UPI001B271C35|nr:MaoC family dehydratase [Oceanobacillus sp. J11TS1]GIO22757.1 hypothetical protein J11TS1_13380 [Oceanobacillus sp. J11TS1]
MISFYEEMEIEITEHLVKQYAAVSGDTNPIHLLKAAANQAGFPIQVAHGMLSMAMGAKIISPLLLNGWMLSNYKMTFSSPLFVYDILRLKTEMVTQTNQRISLKAIGENQHRDRVVCGKIEFRNE